ncbi:MAG TPA: DUF222 domain-containing protein [Acidimicrobiales bacterium]|nr:DUF222 domain-containing protein [Acidimicrobiales bacterium]
MTPSEAADVVRLCSRIEACAAALKALAAARTADSGAWRRDGYRSPADELAHRAGMSSFSAKRAFETGRRITGQPEVALAALAGELSFEQAAAVSDGVAADPTKAGELVAKAKRSSLPELNEEVARVKAANSDQEQRRKVLHARRSLRRWTDRDGAMQAHMYGHPEDGARLWRVLDPLRRRLIMLRRERGRCGDTLDAIDYDAMMTLACVAGGNDGELALADLLDLGLFPQFDADRLTAHRGQAGQRADDGAGDELFSIGASSPPERPRAIGDGGADCCPTTAEAATTKPRRVELTSTEAATRQTSRRGGKRLAGSPDRVMVRVDLDALFRGVALDGELCEIAGYGPVPVSVVKDLLATENPFIVGLLTKGEAVVGVYHHGRHPNAHQRSALDFLYPVCAVEGCPARAGLQYDHREDYCKTKVTAFDLLDRLCSHHHRKKTNQGWALVDGRGKRPFVPPQDPRHPRFSRAPERAGRAPPRAAAVTSTASTAQDQRSPLVALSESGLPRSSFAGPQGRD